MSRSARAEGSAAPGGREAQSRVVFGQPRSCNGAACNCLRLAVAGGAPQIAGDIAAIESAAEAAAATATAHTHDSTNKHTSTPRRRRGGANTAWQHSGDKGGAYSAAAQGPWLSDEYERIDVLPDKHVLRN